MKTLKKFFCATANFHFRDSDDAFNERIFIYSSTGETIWYDNAEAVFCTNSASVLWIKAPVQMPNLKSGATQGAAGAVIGELWHDTDDETVKMGV